MGKPKGMNQSNRKRSQQIRKNKEKAAKKAPKGASKPKTPWNPSAGAAKRVKNKLPRPKVCNVCHAPNVAIKSHKEVYGRDYNDWPWLYYCESCGAYCGMHPFTNIPVGTLADAETRSARTRCKPAFNKLWQSGKMSRNEAYAHLAKLMNIPVGECHFGWFSKAQCEAAYAALNGGSKPPEVKAKLPWS